LFSSIRSAAAGLDGSEPRLDHPGGAFALHVLGQRLKGRCHVGEQATH
jgi:hypothetical protein